MYRYGDIRAVKTLEKLYLVFSMLLRVAVFLGLLLGGMTSMLANLYQKREQFAHRFENVKKYMVNYIYK